MYVLFARLLHAILFISVKYLAYTHIYAAAQMGHAQGRYCALHYRREGGRRPRPRLQLHRTGEQTLQEQRVAAVYRAATLIAMRLLPSVAIIAEFSIAIGPFRIIVSGICTTQSSAFYYGFPVSSFLDPVKVANEAACCLLCESTPGAYCCILCLVRGVNILMRFIRASQYFSLQLLLMESM